MEQKETIISSAANPVIKWLRGLALKKHREEDGVFIIEGARDVQAAIGLGWKLHTLISTPDAKPLAGKKTIITADLMQRVTGRDNAQDTLGVFYQRFSDVTEIAHGLWLGLEEIRDPGNLGTILRTAHAAGAKGIVLIGACCDAFSPEAVAASMGSVTAVKIHRMTQDEFIMWRASYKGGVLGTHLQGAVDYRKASYTPDCLIVMGSEHKGLSDAVAAKCEQKVIIPMPGGTESLNVAIASALMLFEARRVLEN